jgi:uncharacterized protein (DUF952 family)
MILHIARRDAWQRAQTLGVYRGDTLDTQGFIHCSHPGQVAEVANNRFQGQADLLLLCIDESRLGSELRVEEGESGQLFPHIYGPLNLDAVVQVIEFTPDVDGRFRLPASLS